jgi:cobyric acid synthase
MSFTTGLINNLKKKKGIEISGDEYIDFWQYKQMQYDLLADILRKNLDMGEIYDIVLGKR